MPAPDAKLLELARSIGPTIDKHVEQGERDGRLAPPVIAALKEAGLTRLLLPRSLGGHEADPVTVAAVSAEIASHHGAAAWAIMVSNQCATSGASFPDASVEEFFGTPDFMAGIISPPFHATPVKGGFRLSGRHPFASLVRDARWLLTVGLVPKTGAPPDVFLAVMPTSDVRIHETWAGALGMRATDTQDVELADVFVPAARTAPLVPATPNRHYRGELYRMPTAGLAVAPLIAPVALGVAERALREARSVLAEKIGFSSQSRLVERSDTQVKLGRAEALARGARAHLLDALGRAWERARSGQEATMEDKADLVLAATHCAQSSVQAVDLVYSATGTSGVYAGRTIGRLFRDAQVLRQHGFTGEGRYGTAAAMLHGLPPDVPLLAG